MCVCVCVPKTNTYRYRSRHPDVQLATRLDLHHSTGDLQLVMHVHLREKRFFSVSVLLRGRFDQSTFHGTNVRRLGAKSVDLVDWALGNPWYYLHKGENNFWWVLGVDRDDRRRNCV